MSEPVDTKSKKKFPSYLKLVVSDSQPVPTACEEETTSFDGTSNQGFSAQIRKRGGSLYTLVARDPAHHLECSIDLEVQENPKGLKPPSVICRFPDMPAEGLYKIVGEDETLLGMVLIQFQLKVLESILLFCAEHLAIKLLVYTTYITEEDHVLGVYSNLATREDVVHTQDGDKVQITMPAGSRTFDKLVDLMDDVRLRFTQGLWREQRTNPVIRRYLKSRAALAFFGEGS